MQIFHDQFKKWLRQIGNVIFLSLLIVVVLIILVYSAFPYIATVRDEATKWFIASTVVIVLTLLFYVTYFVGRYQGIRYMKEKK